ncbi:MAG TPA: ribokinase, partial [Clostridiaceae bacterium]|nr:ribokinase [Clostridiaceae bacterium]
PVKGETVKGSTFKLGPGGKGSNQGVAAQRAGADVTMITKLGKDDFAEIALKSFKNEGMDTKFVFQDEKYSTGAALIMVDEKTSENEIVVVPGACSNITDKDIKMAKESIENSKVFLTQLETNVDAVEKAVDIAYKNGVTVVLNPAPVQEISDELYKKIDVLTPNEVEASILSGVNVETIEDAKKAANVLMKKGVKNVLITLGSKGVLVVTSQKEEFIQSYKVNVVDTTGAGDAYNGAFATALSEGKDIFEAAHFANAAAAISVTRIGTAPAMAYRNEIEKFISNNK